MSTAVVGEDAGRRGRSVARLLGLATWALVVLAAALALTATLLGYADRRVGQAGAVATGAAYAWGLATRTGGRPVVGSGLALVLGAAVAASDVDVLRSGAAVVTAVLTAVFAIMATVPAPRFAAAVRECVVALLVAALGAMATVAWSPAVDLRRFEYAVLGLSLVAALVTVHRLGAGIHGLGPRGLVTVVGASLLLAVTVGYAELLQQYGTHDLVQRLDDVVRWSHHRLGAFPRPIVALLGVPALTWGTHLRSRRRAGWWVCAFGVGLTAPVAYALVDPGRSVLEVVLATAYGVVIGLGVGFVLIVLELRLSAGGRRGRREARATSAVAAPPEPGRARALW